MARLPRSFRHFASFAVTVAALVECPACNYGSRLTYVYGDSNPGAVRASAERAQVSGSVVRRCPFKDEPVSGFELFLLKDGEDTLVGRDVSGPDGSFLVRSERLTSPFQKIAFEAGGVRQVLPEEPDLSYRATVVLVCPPATSLPDGSVLKVSLVHPAETPPSWMPPGYSVPPAIPNP